MTVEGNVQYVGVGCNLVISGIRIVQTIRNTVQSIVTERKIDYRQMPPEKKKFDRSVALLGYKANVGRGVFRGGALGHGLFWVTKIV